MDGHSALWLFAAGLAGGIVTAVVGGASLLTFPALLAAGLPAIVANASNTVALTPANFVAGLADWRRVPRWDSSLLGLALVAVAGSAAGAWLLLVTPEKAFTAAVPLLIAFATALFAWAGRRRARAASAGPAARRGESADGLRLLLLAPVAVYGGYFGAGMSVMLLAILSLRPGGEYRTVNVLKNLLSGLTSLVAVAVFVSQGVVAWTPTVAMMAGALAGGFLGGRLARVLPPALARRIVIGVGTLLTGVYAWRYWWR